MAKAWEFVRSAVTGIGQGIYQSYRLGGKAVSIAPAILAITIITEFAQHCSEIMMGMFENRTAARAIAQTPERWVFGYIKITGFVLTMLFIARLWNANGSIREAVCVRTRVIMGTTFTVILLLCSAYLAHQIGPFVTEYGEFALSVLSWFLQSGLIVWMFSIWLEKENGSLLRSFSTLLPTAAVMMILFLAAMLPSQALHGLDHKLALGQPRYVIWILMIFDSLVVGLMAAIAGSALYTGFKMQATWRGWEGNPGMGAVK